MKPPYRITPIPEKNLLEEILQSQPGDEIVIGEDVSIIVKKTVEDAHTKPAIDTPRMETVVEDISDPEEDAKRDIENEDKIFNNDLHKCAFSKCPTPYSKYRKQDMAEYDGKLYCTIDCAEKFIKANNKQMRLEAEKTAAHKQNSDEKGWNDKHPKCIQCGTTRRKRFSGGTCTRCYFNPDNRKP